MQLVWSYQVFSLLLDITILIRRNQLRTDGCINDVLKRDAALLIHSTLCNIVDQVANQSLRDTSIDSIHAHVVAIISSPTKCQLREVARSYHHTTHLIGQVHQDLGTLTCLRVLVGHVMHIHIMPDVLEMLSHRLGNADFPDRDTQALHQGHGIVVSTISGTETWHGDTDDTLAIHAQLIKSLDANQ